MNFPVNSADPLPQSFAAGTRLVEE